MRIVQMMVMVMVFASRVEAASFLVESDPAGATITVDGEERGKTPAHLRLPDGTHSFVLSLEGYEDYAETVTADNLVRVSAKLVQKTISVDVFFEDIGEKDWWAFEQLERGKFQSLGKVPGTFRLPEGKHELVLAKYGFWDIKFPLTVTGKSQVVKVEEKPRKGHSSFLRLSPYLIAGTWIQVPEDHDGQRRFEFKADGTYTYIGPGHNHPGRWMPSLEKGRINIRVRNCHKYKPHLWLDGDRLTGKRDPRHRWRGQMWNLQKQEAR